MRDYLNKTIEDCRLLVEKIKFDKSHPWHKYIVSFYGSILELSKVILVLYDARSPIGIAIILRTLLEAYADFKNLCNDPTYGNYLELNNICEELKLYDEAKIGGNPYLEGVVNIQGRDEHLQKLRKRKELLKGKGFKKLKIFEKFQKAQLLNEYRSIYILFSSETHNNLSALDLRHMSIDENSMDYDMHIFKPINPDEMSHLLTTTVGILVDSTEAIHTILRSSNMDRALKLKSNYLKKVNNKK